MPEISHTPYLVTVRGTIFTQHRLILPGSQPLTAGKFCFRFTRCIFPNFQGRVQITDSDIRGFGRKILSHIADGYYTDENGEIQAFDVPTGNNIWWIEIDSVHQKKLPPVYKTPEALPSADGPIIDQVLETPLVEVLNEQPNPTTCPCGQGIDTDGDGNCPVCSKYQPTA